MGKLDGKVVLVTGASSGIGEATARLLAAEGAAVAVAARRREQLEDLVASIAANGGKARAYTVDISSAEAARGLAKSVIDDLGGLDILVNSAGVLRKGPVEGANTDEWEYVVGINVLGTMYVTHAVVPHMMAARHGHIISMSSTAGRFPRPGNSVYAATKAAITAFSDALRLELADYNVRVTTLQPGKVATDLASHSTDPRGLALSAEQRKISMLKPEDIAQTILFCATLPDHVCVCEVVLRPTAQKY